MTTDPRRDPDHYGRRRFDAALLVPQVGGGAADPVVAARPGGRPPRPARQARRRPRRAALRRARRPGRPRALPRDRLRRGDRGRARDPRDVRRRRPHPRLGDHPAAGAPIARAVPRSAIVFSGDLGRRDTPILRDPTVVTDADYVLVESTYGGREHEPEAEAIRILAETVRLVAEHDGVLLVPSFAIGRTQEVVWELDRLVSAGHDPAPAALPRLADGLEGERRLPAPPRLLRRRDRRPAGPPASRRSTTRSRSSRTTSATRRRSPGRPGRT